MSDDSPRNPLITQAIKRKPVPHLEALASKTLTGVLAERERATWAAAANRLAEEMHKTPETRIDVWGVVEEFRAAAQG